MAFLFNQFPRSLDAFQRYLHALGDKFRDSSATRGPREPSLSTLCRPDTTSGW